jgi:parallel beta-helix repeat protein
VTISNQVLTSKIHNAWRSRYTGAYRPFVLAEKRSRLWITNSRLAGLGWNWDDSYGVSWKSGSTGGATASTFTGNYFGVYTAGVSGLVFTRDVVSGSYSYGFDPHSYSSRLTITKNTVTGNGRHGIILAEHVTRSIVEGNTVRANGANGIMIYQASSGNVIRSNMVAALPGHGERPPGHELRRGLGAFLPRHRPGMGRA